MPTQSTAVRALIEQDGKVLIVREASTNPDGTNPGLWEIPGGRIAFGEEPLTALAREVLEETGLTVTVDRPVTMAQWVMTIRGEQVQIIAVYIRCTNPQGDIRLSQEHDAFAWIGHDEVSKYNFVPSAQSAFQDYWKP